MDKTLLDFDNCDIFTPNIISEKMASYLLNKGSLLEPSCGTGNLLKYINIKKYKKIDLYDIKQSYLNECPDKKNINKYCEDFLKKDFKEPYNNIIMNPPYIKFQNLSIEYRNFIKQKWNILNTGNIDIYYAFIMKCLEILMDDGIM